MLKLACHHRVSTLLAGLFTLCLPLTGLSAKIPLETNDVPVAAGTGAERNAKVAMANSTTFVVVYEAPDTSGSGIFFKRYDNNWQLVQGPVAVNTFTDNNQLGPKVALDSSGNFVIVWQSLGQDPGDSASEAGVYARRYLSDGTAVDAAEFRVNTTTASDQTTPSVTVNGVGDFVVVYRSGAGAAADILAQVYDGITDGPSGNPAKVGNEVMVNDPAASSQAQDLPVVAFERFGNFYAVAYTSFQQDQAGGNGIYLRRMSLGGTPLGPETLVNTVTAGNQDRPDIAIDLSGNYDVVWTSENVDGSGTAVVLQRYNSSGVAQGGNIQVNTGSTFGNQRNPHITSSATGTFLVTWTGEESDGNNVGTDIFYKVYDASSSVVIEDTLVSSTTAVNNATEDNATGALTFDGDFVVSFDSDAAGNSDVYLRRIADAPTVTFSNAAATIPESFPSDVRLFRNGKTYALANVTTSATIERTGGTATPGADFTASFPAVVTFPPGETSIRYSPGVVDDGILEPNQTLELALGSLTNGSPGPFTTHALTIQDSSPPPSFVYSNNEITEGDSGTKTMSFTVSLSRASELSITADYTTADYTATVADGDYVAASGSLTFAPGETSKTVTITINGDRKLETDQQFYVNFTNVTNILGGTTQPTTAKILNDDPLPSISISDVTRLEGTSATGATEFDFAVTLSNPSDIQVSVGYSTADNTALASNDYGAASGTIFFNAGVLSQTIKIYVAPDSVDEANQSFFVNLSAATNATIADSQGLGTITNDDTVPTFSISDVTQSEAAGSITFTVTRNGGSETQSSVNFATADGTAVSTPGPADFTAASGTLTFPASTGATAIQTFSVSLNDDMVYEAAKQFAVNLSSPVGATIADGQGIGTIRNDDAAPTFSINDVTRSEADGTATFTITRSGATESPSTVDYATADGTAVSVAGGPGTPDYTATSGTLSFAASLAATATQTFTVALSNDSIYEAAEQFVVNLSNPVDATIANSQGIATITNEDPAPTLTIDDVTVSEGDGQATFTIALSGPTALPIAVNYATVDGTAVASAGTPDYTAASGTLTFNPSAAATQTLTVTVPLVDDPVNEPAEQLALNLDTPTNGATLSDAQGIATVIDDDPVPSFSIGDVTQVEGDSGTAAFTFTVTLSAASGQTATVNYATADGTALDGSDYSATSGTLTFAPGVTTQTVTVLVTGDTVFEPDQVFTVNLSGPTNASITDGQGVGTITNDDAAPMLAINDISAAEADGSITFTVTRTGATEAAIGVDYATADGTALSTAGGPGAPDYTTTSGTLSFAASLAAIATQTFTVALSDDSVYEAVEQFAANLSNPTGATIADGQGIATLTDDDAAPTLAIDEVSLAEVAGPATFTVTLSGATALPIAVNYATADGTAVTANSGPGTPDYTATSGTLTFSPSASATQTLTISIPLIDDTTAEPTEQFALNLSGPTNGSTIADAQGVATITNDDMVPSLSIDDVSLAEGNSGTTSFTFTISLSAPSAQAVTVDYATADDTALSTSGDYAATSGTLIFAPGVTTQTVTVLINSDTTVEPAEQFFVGLSSPTNATIADGQGVGTIIADDVPAVTASTGVIPQAATTLTIAGQYFDPTPANNTVNFNLGAMGTVTAATADSLTVSFTTAPSTGGLLTAVVTANSISSGTPVQVAVVDAIPTTQDDVAYVQKLAAVDIDVLANDSDSGGDTLTITAVSNPAHGTATIIESGARIRYESTESKVAPDSFTYTVTDSHGTTAAANVSISAQLPAQAGTYNGLIQPAISAGRSNAQVGLAKVTINATTGKFTAGLKLAGQSFTATGVFGTDGAAKFGKTGAADFAVKRKGAPELRLTLQVGLDALVDTIEGTLTEASAPFAQLSADRALYTAKKNPILPYQAVPAALPGKYTVRFAALTAPNQNYQATEYPQGDGVGVLAVSTSGVAKLTGTLADGTTFSYANSLSLAKRWPFYVPLMKGAGSISGDVTLGEDANTHSDLQGPGLQWYLPANPKAVRYPQGWPNSIATHLFGSRLVLPEVKSGASVLPGLSEPQPAGNASLHLSGGGLDGAGITQAFNITGKASAGVIQPNPAKATLSVPRTGYFSGQFHFPETNKAGKYKGIIFQNTAQGYGFFLGPEQSGAAFLRNQ